MKLYYEHSERIVVRNIKLFFSLIKRAPKDENKNKKWQEALNVGYIRRLNGMVCIQHFKDTDLKQATKTQPVILRPGAVPSMPSIALIKQNEKSSNLSNDNIIDERVDTIETTETTETAETNKTTSRCNPSYKTDKGCDHLKVDTEDKQSLKTSHNDLIARHNIEVAKFEAKIRKLEAQLAELLKNKKFDGIKSKRHQNSKKKMKETLTQMQKKNLLNQNVVNFVKVIIVKIVIIL